MANSHAGIRQLKRWLLRHDIALVVIEATGKWHRHVHRSLVASAIPVAVADPYRVRRFAQAQGIFAKTDRATRASLALRMLRRVRAPAPQAAESRVGGSAAVGARASYDSARHRGAKFLKQQLGDESDASSQTPPPPPYARKRASGGPPPPLSRGRMKISNLVFATRLCARAMPRYSQASPSKYLPKEGRRSADRRIQRKPHLAMRRALCLFSSPACAEEERGRGAPPRARLSALHRGTSPRCYPQLGPGRASWNHRIQTGEPSPAPVQRAPRGPITRRTGRCPGRPRAWSRTAPAGTALAPLQGSSLETPFDERDSCIVTGTVTDVNRNVTTRFHASLRAQRSNPGRLAGRPSRTGLLRRFAPRNDECPLTRLPRSSRL